MSTKLVGQTLCPWSTGRGASCCKRRTSGWLGYRSVSPNVWRSWGGVRRWGLLGMVRLLGGTVSLPTPVEGDGKERGACVAQQDHDVLPHSVYSQRDTPCRGQ